MIEELLEEEGKKIEVKNHEQHSMTVNEQKHEAIGTNQAETETKIVRQEEERNETQKTKETNPQNEISSREDIKTNKGNKERNQESRLNEEDANRRERTSWEKIGLVEYNERTENGNVE